MGAETAAANAEAGKLERDIGEIQASVAQSKIALQSRKERLEVEYVERRSRGRRSPRLTLIVCVTGILM